MAIEPRQGPQEHFLASHAQQHRPQAGAYYDSSRTTEG